MILRIEESRSPGDASPGKPTTHGAGMSARKARDRDLARTNLAAIEMAVVLIVVALVMVAIILTTGCSNRQPQDLSAARTSQVQQSRAAPVDAQKVGAHPASDGLSSSAVQAPRIDKLDDAKRNALQTEASDMSVGS